MAVKKKKLSPKKTVDSSAVRTDPVGQRGRSDVAEIEASTPRREEPVAKEPPNIVIIPTGRPRVRSARYLWRVDPRPDADADRQLWY
jgi:hypothetical protein